MEDPRSALALLAWRRWRRAALIPVAAAAATILPYLLIGDDTAETSYVEAVERLALDTETTSTDQMIASLVGLSFSWKDGQGVYVPTPLPDKTSTDEVLAVLKPVLESDTPKIGQNLKYDIVVLAQHGAAVNGTLFDTMVAHYLLAPEEPHDLDSISRAYLSYRMVPIQKLIGTGKNQRSMRDVPIDEVGPYACEDADITFRLAEVLETKLEEAGLLEIADEYGGTDAGNLATLIAAEGGEVLHGPHGHFRSQPGDDHEAVVDVVAALARRPFLAVICR